MSASEADELVISAEVQRTVLFSDVVASTQLICREGNASWHRLIARHRSTMGTVCGRHRGQIINFSGDGFVVAFESPARGVDCSLRLQEAFATQAQLDIRIGVHHGAVIPFDDGSYVGLTMHMAARLADLSGPREVVISDSCYRAARRRAAFPQLELRMEQIRGMPDPQAVRISRETGGPWLR